MCCAAADSADSAAAVPLKMHPMNSKSGEREKCIFANWHIVHYVEVQAEDYLHTFASLAFAYENPLLSKRLWASSMNAPFAFFRNTFCTFTGIDLAVLARGLYEVTGICFPQKQEEIAL